MDSGLRLLPGVYLCGVINSSVKIITPKWTESCAVFLPIMANTLLYGEVIHIYSGYCIIPEILNNANFIYL